MPDPCIWVAHLERHTCLLGHLRSTTLQRQPAAAVASKAGISTRSANGYGVWHQVVVTRIVQPILG